jgi:hypothetical protein
LTKQSPASKTSSFTSANEVTILCQFKNMIINE